MGKRGCGSSRKNFFKQPETALQSIEARSGLAPAFFLLRIGLMIEGEKERRKEGSKRFANVCPSSAITDAIPEMRNRPSSFKALRESARKDRGDQEEREERSRRKKGEREGQTSLAKEFDTLSDDGRNGTAMGRDNIRKRNTKDGGTLWNRKVWCFTHFEDLIDVSIPDSLLFQLHLCGAISEPLFEIRRGLVLVVQDRLVSLDRHIVLRLSR